jgi:O-antigen/teichoic acid export membrane protein
MSLLKDFSKDTIVYGLGKGIKKFIGLLLVPIYTRVLSPADFGIVDSLGAGIFFITAFLNFGLDSASGFYFFQPSSESEKGKILFTVFSMRLMVIIPSVIMSFFSVPLSILLFKTPAYSNVVLITCLLIPANMLMSEQELVYRFYRNAWGYNVLTIVKSLVNIGAGVLLVVNFRLGVYGAQMASFVSTMAVVVVSLAFYTRKKYTYKFSFYWAKKLLRFGFPLIWAGIAVWIYSTSDRLILLHYRSLSEIGYFSIGSTFSQPIGLINMAIQMSFGVLFYSVYHKETDPKKPESKMLMVKVIGMYVTVATLIGVGLSVFSHEIIGFMATKKYLPGIVVIPVLVFVNIVAQLTEIVPVGISISEKTWHYTWIIIVAALFNIGLNFLLIPAYGFMAAAFVSLAAYFCYFALSDLISRRYFNSGFSRIKLYLFLGLSFAISFIPPFLEMRMNTPVHFLIKAMLYGFALSLPFFFGYVTLAQLKVGWDALLKIRLKHFRR